MVSNYGLEVPLVRVDLRKVGGKNGKNRLAAVYLLLVVCLQFPSDKFEFDSSQKEIVQIDDKIAAFDKMSSGPINTLTTTTRKKLARRLENFHFMQTKSGQRLN